MNPSIWFKISNSPLFTPEGLSGLIFLTLVALTVIGAIIATNASRLIRSVAGQAFGQHPRKQPEPVREALTRIWISTLYGAQWMEKQSSDLVRT